MRCPGIKPRPRYENLTDQCFDDWTVLGRQPNRRPCRSWKCRCLCGRIGIVSTNNLIKGRSKRCKTCSNRRKALQQRTPKYTHPDEYNIWQHLKRRCLNPKDKNFRHYGARGITVCERWRHSFENFLADMGPRPSPQHSIDRIDNNGDYEPGNCRWATKKEQSRNTRSNRLFTHEGETMCLAEWARLSGVERSCLAYRVRHWTFAEAISLRPWGTYKRVAVSHALNTNGSM